MNRIWIGSGSGMNLKSAIRNLKFAIIMVALLCALSLPAPAQQPKKFELIINLKAAKQISLTILPDVLAKADKVIK